MRRADIMRPNMAAFHLILILATLGAWAPIAALHLILATVRAMVRQL